MSSRFSIFALAAVAIGAAALASTSASAHLPMGVQVQHPVQGLIIHPKPILGVVIHPPHPVLGVVIHPPHPILGVIVNPHPPGVVIHPDPDPPHMVWWHHHHAPEFIEEGVATRTSAPVASVATGPCNCLTKQYLQDGSVLFKDVCTKESALATPDELRAQAQGVGPQTH
jgi:hypothetical protein